MEGFALHILKLNIIAAGIILLVKLMSVFFKGKLTAQWKYLVWLILSLSLLIPVRLPAELSFFHLQVTDTEQKTSQSQPSQTISSVSTDTGTSFSDKNNYPVSSPAVSMSENPESKDSVLENPVTETPSGQTTKKPVFSFKITRQYLPISLHLVLTIFLILWIVIAVLKLICEAAAYYISIKDLKRMSLPVYNPVTVRTYTSVCRLRGVHNPPKLMQNAGLSTPLLTGLLKTELYLPAVGYTAEELKLIFHHELSHYRHKDLWYKMLLRICATVYWFNPFLQIMLKEAENDIENLCDTNVIRYCTTNDHKLYRRLLLRTVAIQNHIPYVTASLNDSTMVFKDRILYMINLKHLKSNVLPGILLSALLIITNASFVLSASASETASLGNTQNMVSTAKPTDNVPATSAKEKKTAIPDNNQEKKQSETVQMMLTEYEMYTISSVNIRTLPSMDSTIINNIPAATTVTVTGTAQDGWFPVKVHGVSGYISQDYLTTNLEEAQAAAAENISTVDSDITSTTGASANTTSDTASQTNNNTPEENDYDSYDTSDNYQNNDQDYQPEPDTPNYDDTPSVGTSNISDPYDLYSWDPGTDSYIPYQQADGAGSPIDQGSGWYYYDSASDSYQPW